LEQNFCEAGAVGTGETAFEDGLVFADAVMLMVDAIALINGDKFLLDFA
jgi:hypothetical protein